ncbi:MAG TPA: GPR1/FUN34/YaaH family transporter, partial [Acidimicrobiales bacterium]|nr:GPR1/FUN34/YaaH family transporter [Acidimicrobiales bacterium]
MAGFALTTFALGLFTSGQIRATNLALVLGLAAFYGGLTQFIAGWFAVARGDLFPAVFMTTYGAFWFSFVALFLFVPRRFVLGVPAAGHI